MGFSFMLTTYFLKSISSLVFERTELDPDKVTKDERFPVYF